MGICRISHYFVIFYCSAICSATEESAWRRTLRHRIHIRISEAAEASPVARDTFTLSLGKKGLISSRQQIMGFFLKAEISRHLGRFAISSHAQEHSCVLPLLQCVSLPDGSLPELYHQSFPMNKDSKLWGINARLRKFRSNRQLA